MIVDAQHSPNKPATTPNKEAPTATLDNDDDDNDGWEKQEDNVQEVKNKNTPSKEATTEEPAE